MPRPPLADSLAGSTIYLHDTQQPLRDRVQAHKRVGPYMWKVPDASSRPDGIGFYMASKGFQMDRHGAPIRLRIEEAPATYSGTTGYYSDEYGDMILTPIIARLPRGRGFLAGWTMGQGMCAELSRDVHETEDEAHRAAHWEAEHAAEAEREYQEQERERLEAEEAEEARLDNLAACHPLQIPAELAL